MSEEFLIIVINYNFLDTIHLKCDCKKATPKTLCPTHTTNASLSGVLGPYKLDT